MVLFTGHHGTDHKLAELILNSNFKISCGDGEWLGDGVYFFVDGLNCDTEALASEWAKCHAWDNNFKTYRYERYAIIQSDINVNEEEFLDLTVQEGVEILTYLAEKYTQKLKTIGKKLTFHDGLLLNLARKEKIFPLEVVKGNFYIKFEKERINRINLRTSNCTICSVYNPNKVLTNKLIVKTGVLP